MCLYTALCNDLTVVHFWGCIDESERERETGGYIHIIATATVCVYTRTIM